MGAGGWLKRHGILFAAIGLLCLYGCPFARLLGWNCPGCGLTRAWLCCLRGEWMQAVEYHALFLPTPLFLMGAAHRDVLPERFRRLLDAALAVFLVLLVSYHLAGRG